MIPRSTLPPRIKSRGGNLSVVGTIDNSTAKEILHTLHRAAKKPTPMVTACVGVGGCHNKLDILILAVLEKQPIDLIIGI